MYRTVRLKYVQCAVHRVHLGGLFQVRSTQLDVRGVKCGVTQEGTSERPLCSLGHGPGGGPLPREARAGAGGLPTVTRPLPPRPQLGCTDSAHRAAISDLSSLPRVCRVLSSLWTHGRPPAPLGLPDMPFFSETSGSPEQLRLPFLTIYFSVTIGIQYSSVLGSGVEHRGEASRYFAECPHPAASRTHRPTWLSRPS